MLNIGITGFAGFIGSHLSNRIPKAMGFVGDLTDLVKVRNFIQHCDIIYHLASKHREEEGRIIKNNLVSTANLVYSINRYNPRIKLIFLSSTQTEWSRTSEFGLVKSVEESMVKEVEDWCIFRSPNVYGPYCKPFYNSVIATFCYQIAHNQLLTINDLNEVREFVYVLNLIEKLLSPIYGKVIRINGVRLSIGEIADILQSKEEDDLFLKKTLASY